MTDQFEKNTVDTSAWELLRLLEDALLAGDYIEVEPGHVLDHEEVRAVFDAARMEMSYWDD